MDGQTDGWMEGRTDGQRTDGRNNKNLGRSFLTKNHPNRSYPRPLLVTSRIAEGASRGGAGAPPGDAMPGNEWLFLGQVLSRTDTGRRH